MIGTADLLKVYGELPRIECKGLCADACGPIHATQLEVDRMELIARRRLSVRNDLSCSLLEGGRCTAYAARPLICRLYGLVRKMRCPYGCVPERWLKDAEAFELMRRVQAIGGPDVSSLPGRH